MEKQNSCSKPPTRYGLYLWIPKTSLTVVLYGALPCHLCRLFLCRKKRDARLVSRRHTTEALTLLLAVVMGVLVLGRSWINSSDEKPQLLGN